MPRRRIPRRFGLIPARAGKTHVSLIQTQTGEAHPRAGGENTYGVMLRSVSRGSSPRGRGKRPWVGGNDRPVGLIPARAGKTN